MNITSGNYGPRRVAPIAGFIASIAGAALAASVLFAAVAHQDVPRPAPVRIGAGSEVRMRPTMPPIYHFYIVQTQAEADTILAANNELSAVDPRPIINALVVGTPATALFLDQGVEDMSRAGVDFRVVYVPASLIAR